MRRRSPNAITYSAILSSSPRASWRQILTLCAALEFVAKEGCSEARTSSSSVLQEEEESGREGLRRALHHGGRRDEDRIP